MELSPAWRQTDLGQIPAEWGVKRLGQLYDFTNGVNADKRAYGHGMRFVNVLEPITFSHLYGPEIPGLVSLPRSLAASYAVRQGDVLFNRTSETESEVGLACVYQGEEPVVFGGFVIRGRPIDSSLDSTYAGYALRAPGIRAQIIPLGQGAVRANIGQQQLRRVVVPIPPMTEQHAIAAALSDVDALLGGLTRLIAKKRDLKQAAMQQLLTGRTRLPRFHGAWEPRRLGLSGQCLRGVSYRGDRDLSKHETAQTIRLLRSNNLQDSAVTTTEVQFVSASCVSQRQRLISKDIVICMANGSKALVGKVGLFDLSDAHPYTFGAFMGCFRADAGAANPEFIFALMQSARYRECIANLLAGSSINNLRPSSIESLEFDFPPLSEQTAIATVLSDMDAELAALEARRAKTQAIKHAMMHGLLTGRIRLVSPEPAHA